MNTWIEGLGKFFASFKFTFEWYLITLFIFLVGSVTGALLLWTEVGRIFRIPTFAQYEYGPYGLITLTSLVCTVLCLIFGIGYSRWKSTKLTEELAGLWSLEKNILKQCVKSGSRTYSAHPQDEAAIGLYHKGLLLREKEYGSHMSVIHTIPLPIWKYLLSHPEIIQLEPSEINGKQTTVSTG